MAARLIVAALLLATVGGGLWWVVASVPEGAEVARGDFRTVVVAPDGSVVADRVVQAEGTPFDALQELASVEGFRVDVEEQPWIGGGCTAHYVVGIAGHRESATGGWNYYVRAGDRGGGGGW